MITGKFKQSVFDIAIKYSGDMQALHDLLVINEHIDPQDYIQDKELKIPDEVINTLVVNKFSNKEIITG